MNRPTLPRGTSPAGATHFYFDPNKDTPSTNPWRRLDIDNSWHMLRGDGWIRISGSRSYNFVAITDMLPGGTFYEQQEMTLRDQFAANAPITYEMANVALSDMGEEGKKLGIGVFDVLATLRFAYADAMMRARK